MDKGPKIHIVKEVLFKPSQWCDNLKKALTPNIVLRLMFSERFIEEVVDKTRIPEGVDRFGLFSISDDKKKCFAAVNTFHLNASLVDFVNKTTRHNLRMRMYSMEKCVIESREVIFQIHFELMSHTKTPMELYNSMKRGIKKQGGLKYNAYTRTACRYCGKKGNGFKRCGRCKIIHYCSVSCQIQDWKVHKKICTK